MTDITSYIDWHVGMKVVCIDASHSKARHFPVQLICGHVYVVRELTIIGGEVGVLLEGLHLPIWPDGSEGAFDPARFRPVQTRKTCIEIFNRILLNPRIRISEDA